MRDPGGASSLTPVLRTHCGDVADRTFHRSLTPPWWRMTYLTLHVLCSSYTFKLKSALQNMSSYTVFIHCTISALWPDFGPGCGVENIGGDELFFNTQYIFQNYNTCVPGGRGLSSLYWQDSFNVIASPLDVCCHGDWDAGKKLYLSYRMNVKLDFVKTGNVYFCFSVNKYVSWNEVICLMFDPSLLL